jgi:hypothetical protein
MESEEEQMDSYESQVIYAHEEEEKISFHPNQQIHSIPEDEEED